MKKALSKTFLSPRAFFMMTMAAGFSITSTTVFAEHSVQIVQQTGSVKGQVIDTNGEPVIGATVKVKGYCQCNA